MVLTILIKLLLLALLIILTGLFLRTIRLGRNMSKISLRDNYNHRKEDIDSHKKSARNTLFMMLFILVFVEMMIIMNLLSRHYDRIFSVHLATAVIFFFATLFLNLLFKGTSKRLKFLHAPLAYATLADFIVFIPITIFMLWRL